MDVDIEPGKYVVAVSGGVDSMVLLDLLRQRDGVELIVAHFDHGIREDSGLDRELVEQTAKRIKSGFKSAFGGLGEGASEATARDARYAFLREIQQQTGAKAIITAHHQDDVLETAVINLLRGTNRRGLTALQSTDGIIRPMLHLTKQQIREYAARNQIVWREDSTNQNDAYLRNYVRRQILPKFTPNQRQELVKLITNLTTTNEELEQILQLQQLDSVIDRQWFVGLPHAVAKEYIVLWLRANKVKNFDKNTVERLTIAAKIAQPGSQIDAIGGWKMTVAKKTLRISKQSVGRKGPNRV